MNAPAADRGRAIVARSVHRDTVRTEVFSIHAHVCAIACHLGNPRMTV